jgi:hypothetical protein
MLAGACLGLVAVPSHAFTIERAEARYVEDHYQFELVAKLDAPVEQVEAVLRDYLNYSHLDERILDSQVLERPQQGVAILSTTVRVCFGPFCRNVKRVERVEEAPLALTATADASRSDVKSGETHTQLSVSEEGTRVTYTTSIVPNFWIPAVVGRRFMLRTLESATINMFTNVEKIASETAHKPAVESEPQPVLPLASEQAAGSATTPALPATRLP